MEDYIIREIDRIGEMLLNVARKLGLLDADTPDYSMAEVKEEFGKAGCPIDLDSKGFYSFRLHSLSNR